MLFNPVKLYESFTFYGVCIPTGFPKGTVGLSFVCPSVPPIGPFENLDRASTLDKQRICLNTQLKSSKKQLK